MKTDKAALLGPSHDMLKAPSQIVPRGYKEKSDRKFWLYSFLACIFVSFANVSRNTHGDDIVFISAIINVGFGLPGLIFLAVKYNSYRKMGIPF